MSRIWGFMETVWRGIRSTAHWYFTSPVPPALGLAGLVGLLVIGAIELGGCA